MLSLLLDLSPADAAVIQRFYHYIPSKTAAAVFVTIYCILSAVVILQLCRTKQLQTAKLSSSLSTHVHTNNNRLLWTILVTAMCITIGIGLRIQMLVTPTLMVYIVHEALLIITPNALAYVDYSILGKLIATSERNQPDLLVTQPFYLRGRLVARLFLLSDFLAFFIQSSSTGLLTNKDPDLAKMGSNIMVAGLIIQLCFFTFFTFLTIFIHRNPIYKTTRPEHCNPLFKLLYITITLLYIRSFYRLVEFAQGRGGSIASNESLFYMLDATPVAMVVLTYLILNPNKYLNMEETTTSTLTTISTVGQEKGAAYLYGTANVNMNERIPNEFDDIKLEPREPKHNQSQSQGHIVLFNSHGLPQLKKTHFIS